MGGGDTVEMGPVIVFVVPRGILAVGVATARLSSVRAWAGDGVATCVDVSVCKTPPADTAKGVTFGFRNVKSR